MTQAPVVAVVGCNVLGDVLPYHLVYHVYTDALIECAGALPVLMPSLGRKASHAGWLASVDGLLLTGSVSNVNPSRYGDRIAFAPSLCDDDRDETVFALVHDAVASGIPLFGICRGCQEINVAFGGSLWQQVQDVPGKMDHRPRRDLALEEQYRITHPVSFVRNGWLEQLTGGQGALVNSRHSQGIRDLGAGLRVEAVAEDGIIEAVSVEHARRFAFATQWHPEYRASGDTLSRLLFGAFGAACRERMHERLSAGPGPVPCATTDPGTRSS